MSEEDLFKILKSSPSTSCYLDPIPMSLVKECADILITPITKIVNYSIKEGSFPNCFKMAYVTPLQKKSSLDRNILKNYRPVSNLSFISKLIEKVVAKQLNKCISCEGLLNVNHSAYKSSHSTETALLKSQNDIALSRPIEHCIFFKYNILVFKAINLRQPPYLSALIRLSSLTSRQHTISLLNPP